jgi:hypothetical protein
MSHAWFLLAHAVAFLSSPMVLAPTLGALIPSTGFPLRPLASLAAALGRTVNVAAITCAADDDLPAAKDTTSQTGTSFQLSLAKEAGQLLADRGK